MGRDLFRAGGGMRVPVPCAERGCINYAYERGRCEQHQRQAFAQTRRKERLPSDWLQRRRAVLSRDGGMCVVPKCEAKATEVDHIVHGDDHAMSNLQSLCTEHHRVKTAYEGNWAQGRGWKHVPTWLRKSMV